jgi:hypothetical protein
VFIVVSLILFIVSGTNLPFFKSKPVYGQPQEIDNSLSEQKRLGTDNILYLPDDVSLLYGNHQNASFDQEFVLLGKNQSMTNRNDVAIVNPDFGLSTPVPTLRVGENFNINSTVDPDTDRYRSVSVLLVPITSPFPPANTAVEDVDPEFDLALSTPIVLGNYTGDSGTFVIPHTASPGYYLLYAYVQYPTYNMTVVYNTPVQVTSSSAVPTL